MPDVLVLEPFRRPTFRKAISSQYPVQEPWDSPPLLLAGALRDVGLDVDYLALQNLLASWDEPRDLALLRRMLAAVPSRLVIFSGDYFIPSRSTATLFGIRVVSRELRAARPDVVVGVAGRLATTAGAAVLDAVPECDFLVHGEPESVIGEIATQVLRGGVAALDHPSAVTRRGPGAGRAPTAATVGSLDALAMPAWDLLRRSLDWWDVADGRRADEPVQFSLRTSAGCKFRCLFCAGVPNWLNYRMKSAGRVGAEIDTLREATGGRVHFSFLEDEIFTRDPDHVRAVSEVCQERGVRFDGVYTHSSLLGPEVADPLSRMANRVFFGLDNPDDSILREMRKGQRFDTVLAAVENARRAGLGSHLEWIIGSPADTLESLAASLNLIVTLYSTGVVESINTYVYCPHPGTEYAGRPDLYGLRIIDGPEDMQESGGYPAYETSNLSRDQIFTAYLMSQLAIAEIGRDRDRGALGHVGSSSRGELLRILGKVGGGR
jgi:radical SAM superfamily enzyme YgiQ (UPF0313 family)